MFSKREDAKINFAKLYHVWLKKKTFLAQLFIS